jgi:cation:H+ antiporter
MIYFLFFLGFVILILGAKFLVDGAASIGTKAGLSQLVIGLTVVALGTSLPEFVINVFASIKGNTGLAIGNVLGSNIMNTLLIIGIAATIYPIKMPDRKCRTDVLFSLMSTVVIFILANDMLFGRAENFIDRSDGLILLAFLLAFLYYSFFVEKKVENDGSIRQYGYALSVVFIIAGGFGLYFGGKWIVSGASQIAADLGMSDTLIGLTIVAVATSLPELVTSIIAAMKKNTALAIGNAVGSNVFNVFLVLGSSSIITAIPFQFDLNIELAGLFASGLLVIFFIHKDFGKPEMAISRIEGGILILMYILYFIILLFWKEEFIRFLGHVWNFF